jgi:hypothetical protein
MRKPSCEYETRTTMEYNIIVESAAEFEQRAILEIQFTQTDTLSMSPRIGLVDSVEQLLEGIEK